LIVKKSLLAAVFAVSIANAASAQTLAPKAVNGEWTGALLLDNSSPQLSLDFALTDTSFKGMVYADGKEFGAMEGGSLRGNKVHFKANGLDFTGTVTGAKMAVDLIVYNGSTRKLTLTKTPSTGRDTLTDVAGLRSAWKQTTR
jgi:hypothetical protein